MAWGLALYPGCKERSSPITLFLHLVQGRGLVWSSFLMDRILSEEQRMDAPSCVHVASSCAVPGPRPWPMCPTLVCSPLLPIQPLTLGRLFFPSSLSSKSLPILSFSPSLSRTLIYTLPTGVVGRSVLAEGAVARLPGLRAHPTRPRSLSVLCLHFLI